VRSYPGARRRATPSPPEPTTPGDPLPIGPRVLLASLLVPFLLAGCGERGDMVSRERFIAANVALRRLADDATAQERDEVLARYRVDADDLRRWLEHHAGRPDVLSATWHAVAERLDSLAAERPVPLERNAAAEAPRPDPGDPPDPPPGAPPPRVFGPREIAEQLAVPAPPAPAGPHPRRGGAEIQ
jgi:hypothetical protein